MSIQGLKSQRERNHKAMSSKYCSLFSLACLLFRSYARNTTRAKNSVRKKVEIIRYIIKNMIPDVNNLTMLVICRLNFRTFQKYRSLTKYFKLLFWTTESESNYHVLGVRINIENIENWK